MIDVHGEELLQEMKIPSLPPKCPNQKSTKHFECGKTTT